MQADDEDDESRYASRCEVLLSKLMQARQLSLHAREPYRHHWHMQPVLMPRELDEFEQAAGVRLPGEYRAFLQRVGRSEVGLGDGLFGLHQAVHFERPAAEPTMLSLQFRHLQAFNPEAEFSALCESCDRGELGEDELDRRVALQVGGTLVLAHDGCGILHMLVVSGPTRGQVWYDLRVDGHGLFPQGVGFFDWYEARLDRAIANGKK